MGVVYIAYPLDDQLCAWLDTLNVGYPSAGQVGRNPTPREVRTALSRVPSTRATFSEPKIGARWSALIEPGGDAPDAAWAQLAMTYLGEDEPSGIAFEKGWPTLIIAALQQISVFTGPIALVPDTGEDPVVVTINVDVEAILAAWQHSGGSR